MRSERSWRRPWEQLPQPIIKVTLAVWGLLPPMPRRWLGPLGHVFNPHQTTKAQPMPGASTVPGVADLRADGFTPIEELTGFVEVALVWPEHHRRSTPEVRDWWLGEPLNGQLWLVRPPWASWTIEEVLSFLWSVIDDQLDHQARLDAAADALRWPEARARAQAARVITAHSPHDSLRLMQIKASLRAWSA